MLVYITGESLLLVDQTIAVVVSSTTDAVAWICSLLDWMRNGSHQEVQALSYDRTYPMPYVAPMVCTPRPNVYTISHRPLVVWVKRSARAVLTLASGTGRYMWRSRLSVMWKAPVS